MTVLFPPPMFEGRCERCGGKYLRGPYPSWCCPSCEDSRRPSAESTSPFRERVVLGLAVILVLCLAAGVTLASGLAAAISSVATLVGAESDIWGVVLGTSTVLVAMMCVLVLGIISFELLMAAAFLGFLGSVIGDEAFDAPRIIQVWLMEAGVPAPMAALLDGPMSMVFGIACFLGALAALVALTGGVAFLARLRRKEERP